jgi:hypothetical protein
MMCCAKVLTFLLRYEIRTFAFIWPGLCSFDQPRPSLTGYALLMVRKIDKRAPKLHQAPQPPLSHPGAIPDSDRAKNPPLGAPLDTNQELNPGDRVEGLGNFGKPNGELGTVERTNDEDAVVKWDGDGRTRLHQPELKKI